MLQRGNKVKQTKLKKKSKDFRGRRLSTGDKVKLQSTEVGQSFLRRTPYLSLIN